MRGPLGYGWGDAPGDLALHLLAKHLPSATYPGLGPTPQDLRTTIGGDLCKVSLIRAHPSLAARLFILIPVFDLDPLIALVKHRVQLEIDIPPASLVNLRRKAYVYLQPSISRIADPPRHPRTAHRQQHHNGYRKGAAVMRSTPW